MILVSIDTLCSHQLSAYGCTRIETPFLGRFRAEATLYEHASAPCPMTLPAHVTALTGALPFEQGVRDNWGSRSTVLRTGTCTGCRAPDTLKPRFPARGRARRLQRNDEAEEAFRRGIGAFPGHSRAYASLAALRFLRGDRAHVCTLLNEMTRANPSPRT